MLCSLEGVLFVQVGSNSGMDLHDSYTIQCGTTRHDAAGKVSRWSRSTRPFNGSKTVMRPFHGCSRCAQRSATVQAGAQEMVTGIGWSGEATRFVWNARAQKCGGQVGAPKSEGLPSRLKFLKTSNS